MAGAAGHELAECQERKPRAVRAVSGRGRFGGGFAKQGRERALTGDHTAAPADPEVEEGGVSDKTLASEEIRNIIDACGTGVGADDFDGRQSCATTA